MRTRKIKTLLALSLTLVLTVSISACNTTTQPASTSSIVSQPSAISGTNSGTTKYSDDNDTKVKQMLDNVTLNGKPLKIPYKLSDLGEGYTFDSSVDIEERNGKTYAMTKLMYNNEEVSYVFLSNYSENQKVNDFVAYSISFSDHYENNTYTSLQIDGIGGDSSRDDVLRKFGIPTNIENTKIGQHLIYEVSDDIYIYISVTNENDIIDIDIVNKT